MDQASVCAAAASFESFFTGAFFFFCACDLLCDGLLLAWALPARPRACEAPFDLDAAAPRAADLPLAAEFALPFDFDAAAPAPARATDFDAPPRATDFDLEAAAFPFAAFAGPFFAGAAFFFGGIFVGLGLGLYFALNLREPGQRFGTRMISIPTNIDCTATCG